MNKHEENIEKDNLEQVQGKTADNAENSSDTGINDEVQANVDDKKEADEQEKPELTDVEKLAAAEAEIAKLNDRLLRQIAEFDNYRKRTLKEKTELILGGGEKVLTALLPVLDDLERAQQNIESAEDVAALKEGVELIVNKLVNTLSGQGLKKIDTEGKEFDTDYHEAIAMLPVTDEAQKNHIIDCVQAGYTLNEKVIRHAKVVVGQ